jgi:multidrug efflux pump subunit AcrA (membrane-fusion protein)
VVDANGVVHLRAVTIGQDLGQSLEIESGIEPTDRIIVNPSDSIADGDHVEIASPSADKGLS